MGCFDWGVNLTLGEFSILSTIARKSHFNLICK